MLRVKQEEENTAHLSPTSLRVPTPPQPSEATLSADDERFLAQLRSGETRTGGERVLPTLVTPPQAVVAPPSTLSLPEWWDHLIRHNPVYHKETLAQRRLQEKKQISTRLTEQVLGVVGTLGLYAGMFYLISLAVATSEPAPAFWGMHSFLIVLQCLILMIAMPLQAATSITSEREKMTWNALLLSRISPLQILAGKAAATLRPIALVYGAMLPALVITALGTGMAWTNFLAAQVLILLTCLLNVSAALNSSLVSKKSQQASGNAGGWAIIPLLGLPALTGVIYAVPSLLAHLLNTQFVPPDWFAWVAWVINLFNPAVAIVAALSQPELIRQLPSWLWFFVPTFYLAAASLGIRALWKRMLDTFWQAPKDLSG